MYKRQRYSFTAQEILDGEYTSWGDYQNRRTQGIIGGYLGLGVDLFGEGKREDNPPTFNNKVDVNVMPYLVDTYPNIRFFDAAVNTRVDELRTEINAYVNENYVAFISGEKEMTDANLEEFFKTIHDLGYDEYVGYFIDYYENVYKADK